MANAVRREGYDDKSIVKISHLYESASATISNSCREEYFTNLRSKWRLEEDEEDGDKEDERGDVKKDLL